MPGEPWRLVHWWLIWYRDKRSHIYFPACVAILTGSTLKFVSSGSNNKSILCVLSPSNFKMDIYILIFYRIKYLEIFLTKFNQIARCLHIFIGFNHSFIVWVAWGCVFTTGGQIWLAGWRVFPPGMTGNLKKKKKKSSPNLLKFHQKFVQFPLDGEMNWILQPPQGIWNYVHKTFVWNPNKQVNSG